MWTKLVALLSFVALAAAQIPSLGWCPDYQPMAKFDMNRFLGQWHEAERYFSLSEVGSRCVTTNYANMSDGRVWVSNEIRNSFTGVKRVVEGQLQVVGRDGEGKLSVKYTSLPVPYEAQYLILDTDYKSFAVMWSCSGAGPVHAQNAWILTRERLAPGAVLQRAYGILDKLKISRAFFVVTNQEDCIIQPAPLEAADPTPNPEKVDEKPDENKAKHVNTPPVVAEEKKEEKVEKQEDKPTNVGTKSAFSVPELIKKTAENNPVADDKQVKVEEPVKVEPAKVEPVKENVVVQKEEVKQPEPAVKVEKPQVEVEKPKVEEKPEEQPAKVVDPVKEQKVEEEKKVVEKVAEDKVVKNEVDKS